MSCDGTGNHRVVARIRPAQEDNLPELVRIYNHYVRTSHITFDIEPFAVEERRVWLKSFSLEGPYRLLVADTGSQLAGYTSSKGFRLVGTFKEVGLKFGKYWDVSWYEKSLAAEPPVG